MMLIKDFITKSQVYSDLFIHLAIYIPQLTRSLLGARRSRYGYQHPCWLLRDNGKFCTPGPSNFLFKSKNIAFQSIYAFDFHNHYQAEEQLWLSYLIHFNADIRSENFLDQWEQLRSGCISYWLLYFLLIMLYKKIPDRIKQSTPEKLILNAIQRLSSLQTYCAYEWRMSSQNVPLFMRERRSFNWLRIAGTHSL